MKIEAEARIEVDGLTHLKRSLDATRGGRNIFPIYCSTDVRSVCVMGKTLRDFSNS